MATSNIAVTAGSGVNVATNSISEDAITKQLQRTVINSSTGTELATSSNPLQVSLANTAPNSTAVKVDNSAVTQPVAGTVATNVAITDNPLNLGAQAISSENTAVTATRKVQAVADLTGKLIVLPYANPENFLNGTTAAITDTTSTQVIAAQSTGIRIYVTSILVTNSHATVGTFVKILDGASIIYEGFAAAVGGGFSVSLPVPLRGTAATALNAQCVTTGSNVIVSCAGYKGV